MTASAAAAMPVSAVLRAACLGVALAAVTWPAIAEEAKPKDPPLEVKLPVTTWSGRQITIVFHEDHTYEMTRGAGPDAAAPKRAAAAKTGLWGWNRDGRFCHTGQPSGSWVCARRGYYIGQLAWRQ